MCNVTLSELVPVYDMKVPRFKTYSLGRFVSVRRLLIRFEVVSHGLEDYDFCLLYYKTVCVDRCCLRLQGGSISEGCGLVSLP
jgi:hypothetical protein